MSSKRASRKTSKVTPTPPPADENAIKSPPVGSDASLENAAGNEGELENNQLIDKDKSEVKPNQPHKKLDGCQKCCSSMMKFIAHDAVYGSFVGPHPVSFMCLCYPCRKCCSKKCVQPTSVASIATKIMYFIMLGFVSLLACFFIIPWKKTAASLKSTSLYSFWPCQKGKLKSYDEFNGGCLAHAGYFMAYRCFFAFGTVMLTNSLIMLCVKSTKIHPHRAKIHRGFWFYKYLYLGACLTIYFLFLDGKADPNGIFEFFVSIIGNIASVLFGFVEITFVLDIIELWVIENRTSRSNWGDFMYDMFTTVVVILDLGLFIYILKDYSVTQQFPDKAEWPNDNCIAGKMDWGKPDGLHLTLILGSVSLVILLIVITSFKKFYRTRFPNTGWLQAAVITLFNFIFLWSALASSPNVHSRPHCNWAYSSSWDSLIALTADEKTNDTHAHTKNITEIFQEGSYDVYATWSGVFHGFMAIFALLYFAFVHGPRSGTAPFSIVYYLCIFNDSRIPLFPDEEDSPQEFLDAVEKYEVWDDEEDELGYSWSLFYFMMMIGGFSLMMAMTNFTDPWSKKFYNSSMIATGCKFGTVAAFTTLYLLLLLIPCTKVDSEAESELQERRKYKRKNIVNEETKADEGDDVKELLSSDVNVAESASPDDIAIVIS